MACIILKHNETLSKMLMSPSKYFPSKEEQVKLFLKDPAAIKLFNQEVQRPMLWEALKVIKDHDIECGCPFQSCLEWELIKDSKVHFSHLCWGFICQPFVNQRTNYNGHKRVHSLKFQSVTLPNGLIAHLFGPVGKYLISYIFLVPTITKSVPCPFCDTFVKVRCKQFCW